MDTGSKTTIIMRDLHRKIDAIGKLTEQLKSEQNKIMEVLKSNSSELASEVEQDEARQRKLLECIQAQID